MNKLKKPSAVLEIIINKFLSNGMHNSVVTSLEILSMQIAQFFLKGHEMR